MRKISFGKVFIVLDFFSKEEINLIHNTLELKFWQKDEMSDNKILNLSEISDKSSYYKEVSDIFDQKTILLKNIIEQDFTCVVSPEELGTVINFASGWTLHLHSDSWSNLPTHAGYPSRDISSITYLTDQFIGGNLVFPYLGIQIEPMAGSVVYFPSDEEHMHEVTQVISGDRWACTSFWNILSS